MESKSSFFIAVYTNKCKDYCDQKFFNRILTLKRNNYLGIVDNTRKGDYVKRLRTLAPTAAIEKIDVPENPKKSQFQRNVTESVNRLREDFLNTNKDYFLIIESDVIPPVNLLTQLDLDIKILQETYKTHSKPDDKPWGILGAVYYKGFHNYSLTGIQQTNHVLSGCTLYKRELIEKYPFRYNEESLAQFPDYWICYDSGHEYSLWNDHNIICEHLHTEHGTRISHIL